MISQLKLFSILLVDVRHKVCIAGDTLLAFRATLANTSFVVIGTLGETDIKDGARI